MMMMTLGHRRNVAIDQTVRGRRAPEPRSFKTEMPSLSPILTRFSTLLCPHPRNEKRCALVHK